MFRMMTCLSYRFVASFSGVCSLPHFPLFSHATEENLGFVHAATNEGWGQQRPSLLRAGLCLLYLINIWLRKATFTTCVVLMCVGGRLYVMFKCWLQVILYHGISEIQKQLYMDIMSREHGVSISLSYLDIDKILLMYVCSSNFPWCEFLFAIVAFV